MQQFGQGLHTAWFSRRRVIAAMATAPLAAALLTHGIAVGAENPPATPPALSVQIPFNKVAGTVTNVSGGILTIQQSDGTAATVTTDSNTGAMLLKSVKLSDLQVGDIIGITGDKTGDTTFTAKNIMHLNGAKGLPTISKQGAAGTVVMGTPPAGFPDKPSTGGNLVIGYAQGTSGSLPAGVPPPDGKPRTFVAGPGDAEGKPGLIGQITAISGTTLTVKTPEDTSVTVSTDASTTVLTDEQGSVSDIKVGDTVTAITKKDGSSAAVAITYRHNG